MWILNEYRFVLILGVIALSLIIFYFFSIQNQHEKTDFLNDFRGQYTVLKEGASVSTSLYDVLNRNALYTQGSLLWRKIDKTHWIHIYDNLGNISTISGLALPDINTGYVNISFGLTRDYPNIRNYNTTDGTIEFLVAPEDNNLSYEDRGWGFDTGWYFFFTFENEAVALRVYNSTFPEGDLILNTTTNQRDTIALSYNTWNRQASISWDTTLGTLIRTIPVTLAFDEIKGIKIQEEAEYLFFNSSITRIYSLSNGALWYYNTSGNNIVTLSPVNSYVKWRGYDISPNNSYAILLSEAWDLYYKNLGDTSIGTLLFSWNIVNPQFIDNNNFFYYDFSDQSIKKYNLVSSNVSVIDTNVSPQYFYKDNYIFTLENNEIERIESTGVSTIIQSNVEKMKLTNDRILLEMIDTSYQEIDIDGNVLLSSEIPSIDFDSFVFAPSSWLDEKGIQWFFWDPNGNDIIKEAESIPYIGGILYDIVGNSIIYQDLEGDLYLYDVDNPQGYSFTDNIWESNPIVVPNNNLSVEVIGTFPEGTWYRVYVTDEETDTEILNTAILSDRNNIILQNSDLYVDNLDLPFTSGITGRQLLTLTNIGSFLRVWSESFKILDIKPYGHWKLDTGVNDLATYTSHIISFISRNYTLLNEGEGYRPETENLFIKLEILPDLTDTTKTPEVTSINVYNKDS